MKFFKYLSVAALAIALVACGGGGAESTTPVVTTPVVTTPAEKPASIEVLTSSNTLQSAGSEAVITAFIKNGNNVGMAGQTVSFSASSGTLQSPSLVTDDSGAVTAKLSAGSNKAIRDITVTVTAGTASGNVVIPVTGTRISIAGSGSLQVGGSAAQYTVRAVDSSGNPINGASIAVNSALGNALAPNSLVTDSSGNATFMYTPNIAGAETLKVSGLGSSATTAVIISAIDFITLSPSSNTLIPVGSSQVVTVQYKLSGVGVSGKTVAFSTTRGSFTTANAVTNASGAASATLSSTTAGPAVVIAQIVGVGQVNLPVQFVATTPATIVVQANPGAVLPNPSGTANQSTIEAVVRDDAGNSVANRQVNFSTLQDISNGTLSPGVATTDANGRAQVQFIPGATSTPANGVLIQAEVASTAIRSTTSLTVNGQALFITLGFGNTISNLDETTYSKPFSVYVTDANGVAVGNQQVTLAVIPEEYYKGALAWNGTVWTYAAMPTVCPNEDLNGDGVLGIRVDNNATEDTNGDRQLTPGNVVVAAPGNVTTDTSGRATLNLQYGEQYAPWVRVRIAARASVGGTESRQSILFALNGSAPDFTDETAPPAGVRSPFGVSTLCTNSN
ncbi:Ig-like domain-containing protein [Polaromonas hydrogenivorans]|uniref:Ig-like domain-containing protein n=1 Tax=Polaromonas hydrogenivorans TaxID=335476 RepID=A0AAU7LPY7_9BURK